jgi:hypothetical protein
MNDITRHEYRTLDGADKHNIASVKDYGEAFISTLFNIGGVAGVDRNGQPNKQSSRELQIAQERIEEAVMWAVKHITRPT